MTKDAEEKKPRAMIVTLRVDLSPSEATEIASELGVIVPDGTTAYAAVKAHFETTLGNEAAKAVHAAKKRAAGAQQREHLAKLKAQQKKLLAEIEAASEGVDINDADQEAVA